MKSLNDSLEEYKKIEYNKNSLQSYARYLERLKTFEISKWFAKSSEFSPLECSKLGWYNLNVDTLKCVSCANILFLSQQSRPSLSRVSNEKSPTTSKTTNWSNPKRLIEEHNPNCPWRTLSVPNQFIQIDVFDDNLMFKSFAELFKTYKNSTRLPVLDRNILKVFDSVGSLNSNAIHALLDNEAINKTKIVLSCSGWSFIQNKDMLKCERCLRSIGLWLYRREGDKEKVLAEEEESAKNCSLSTTNKRKLADVSNETGGETTNTRSQENEPNKKSKELNPMREHFGWCPWLVQLDSSTSLVDSDTNKTKRIDKTPCLVFYELVCKRLESTKKPSDSNEANKTSASSSSSSQQSQSQLNVSTNLDATSLIDRAKSAHSMIINCASLYSNKLN